MDLAHLTFAVLISSQIHVPTNANLFWEGDVQKCLSSLTITSTVTHLYGFVISHFFLSYPRILSKYSHACVQPSANAYVARHRQAGGVVSVDTLIHVFQESACWCLMEPWLKICPGRYTWWSAWERQGEANQISFSASVCLSSLSSFPSFSSLHLFTTLSSPLLTGYINRLYSAFWATRCLVPS